MVTLIIFILAICALFIGVSLLVKSGLNGTDTDLFNGLLLVLVSLVLALACFISALSD